MRTLLALLAVTLLPAAGGCDNAGATAAPQRFAQGSVSMEPTVESGQVVNVREVGRDYRPRRGDIVLFHGDGALLGDTTESYLKRIIAVGGETIACCDQDGRVTVDGTALDEPYVADNSPLDVPPNPRSCGSRRFGPVAVPKDAVFVMGDNRPRSSDSRCIGTVPVTSVHAVMIS